MATNTPSKQLYDILVSKNYDPQLLDASGMPAQDPAGADVLSFDYVGSSGKDYGTVVVMLGDEHNMTVYFGDNVGKSMEGEDKKEWFDFLYQLRMMSKRNLLSFSLQNLNKLKHSMKTMSNIKESIFESWMGNKTTSWNNKPTEARLMIKHTQAIGEGQARYRYVESLFIETVDGERFKLPFTKITGGKAMLEHIRQGGKPYDVRGEHISGIVNEMNVLSRFYKSHRGIVAEDVIQLVEEVKQYHVNLKETLAKLASKRGYKNYFESWNPETVTERDMVIEGIRTIFANEHSQHRTERLLPALTKIKNQGNIMKETGIFEGWINCLAEGTWELPDTPEKQQKLVALLSKELPVGPDATNATEQLYDILGDDDLFDQLEGLAKDDANADARTIIINRLQQMASNPAVAQVIGKLKIEQKPVEEPEEPVQEEREETEECYEEENIDEQIQRIAELSGDTLKSYINKATAQISDKNVDDATANKRFAGISKAIPKKNKDSDKMWGVKYMEEGHQRTIADLSDDELESCVDGSTDLDLLRKIAIQNELDSGGVEAEDFAFDFAEAVSNNDSESYEANEEWGASIADNINQLLAGGLEEASDTVKLDPKTGKPVSWSHEGDWKKTKKRNGKEVDARGEVTNMAGKELKKAASLEEGQSIADYKKKIAAMPDAEVKSLLTVMVGHNRDNPWDQGIIKLLKRELDNRSEQLDELSPDTLGSYVKKASSDRVIRNFDQGYEAGTGKAFDWDSSGKDDKRRKGIIKAVDRLVREDEEPSPVESAIINRIMMAHSDLLAKYGPEAVMDAARSEADFVGDVDEIGSSDVSAWVKNVIWELEKSAEYLKSRKVDESQDDMTDMTKWMDKFDAYEDKNYHTENLIRLAKLVGTPDDVQEAKLIKADHEHKGEMTPVNIVRRSKLFKKLWPLAQKKEFDWNERVNTSKTTDEGMIGRVIGTIAGDALGGPVGGAIGGMAGDAIQDKFTNESTALTGQYGHSGKMKSVKADDFGDKFAEDIARLKALALIK